MAKKTTSTRKTGASAKKSARKTAPRRPPKAGNELSTSVLDGSMKSVFASAFLRSN